MNFKRYRRRTDRIVGIPPTAAALLHGLIQRGPKPMRLFLSGRGLVQPAKRRPRCTAIRQAPPTRMPPVDRVRPRIGDVIEIATPNGLAYAHYTHRHARYGALLRVMPRLHATRPSDFSDCVSGAPQFTCFFPLGAACTRRLVAVVGHESVPASQIFPVFRTRASKGEPWWLWDGEKEWKIGVLQPGMEHYPVRGIWNDTLLIERIGEGWRHESEV